jgi:hypothetical protein
MGRINDDVHLGHMLEPMCRAPLQRRVPDNPLIDFRNEGDQPTAFEGTESRLDGFAAGQILPQKHPFSLWDVSEELQEPILIPLVREADKNLAPVLQLDRLRISRGCWIGH